MALSERRAFARAGSFIVFWAGMRSTDTQKRMCSIIGFFWVAYVVNGSEVGPLDAHRNAHSRYVLSDTSEDVIVFASPDGSGRLRKHIPIGEAILAPGWTRAQQCIFPDTLEPWGQIRNEDGSYIKNGYIQRSMNPPFFADGGRFLDWLSRKKPKFVNANNA